MTTDLKIHSEPFQFSEFNDNVRISELPRNYICSIIGFNISCHQLQDFLSYVYFNVSKDLIDFPFDVSSHFIANDFTKNKLAIGKISNIIDLDNCIFSDGFYPPMLSELNKDDGISFIPLNYLSEFKLDFEDLSKIFGDIDGKRKIYSQFLEDLLNNEQIFTAYIYDSELFDKDLYNKLKKSIQNIYSEKVELFFHIYNGI